MQVQKSWQCFNIALLLDTIRLRLMFDLGVLCQIPFLTQPQWDLSSWNHFAFHHIF